MNKIELLINFSKEFLKDSKYEFITPEIFKVLSDLLNNLILDLEQDYKEFYLKYFFNDIWKYIISYIFKFLNNNIDLVYEIKKNKFSKNIMICKNELFKKKKKLNKKQLFTKLKSLLIEIEFIKFDFYQILTQINNIQTQLKGNNITLDNFNNYKSISNIFFIFKETIDLNKNFKKHKSFRNDNQKIFLNKLFLNINNNIEINLLLKNHIIKDSIINLFKEIKIISFELYDYKLYDKIESNKNSLFINNKNTSSFKDSNKESSYKKVNSYIKAKKSFYTFNESRVNLKESFNNNESFKKFLNNIINEMDEEKHVVSDPNSVNNDIIKPKKTRNKKYNTNNYYYCKIF